MKIKQKGFTLIELMITVSIFAIMTALLVAKYGAFNNGVLLTNLAYDIALNIRSAQSYGLNTKGTDTFDGQYTVTFVKGAKDFNLSGNGIDKTTNIKRGSSISRLCVGADSNSCSDVNTLKTVFIRPNPNALIQTSSGISVNYNYGEIEVSSVEGVTKKIVVRSTGQIYVSN